MYNGFYGFSENPFELTPDPKFLFLTPSLRHTLASVMDGIRERKGFISIIGEAGTGKTTLLHSLLGSLDEKVKTVFIFHTTVSFKDLLKTILQELDLHAVEKGKDGLLKQLIQYSTQIATKNETLVIIIDEAHKLSEEVMKELQVFSSSEYGTIQIVLVGQPELEDMLNSASLRQLKQAIKVDCQVKVLSEEESGEYIGHRLRLVGKRGLEIFTPQAISMIYQHSQGIPRIINTLCDNAFLTGYKLDRERIDQEIIREVIKNLEGPGRPRGISPPITKGDELRPSAHPSHFPWRIVIFTVLVLLCLGILSLLIYGQLSKKAPKTWDIASLKSPTVETEPSSTPSPPAPPPPSPPPVSQPTASLPALDKEPKLKEIVNVKTGYTLYSLTQKYYRMVNETLIDLILEVNPEIKNIHLILIDQKIRFPLIAEELLIIESLDRTYKINAGTFDTPAAAKRYSHEPALKGKKIEVIPRKVSPGESWYRVVIGQFDNKDEALKVIHLLKKKGLLPAFK